MDSITVLMSTYNGEKYLREQINSILNQIDVNLKLLIRDDGSTDSTIEILNEFKEKDSRVTYYSGENLGPCYSFLDLMNQPIDTDYVSLSDQDDVWDKDKLIIAIRHLKEKGSNCPVLYYSNLRVVDKDLNFIKNIFDKSQEQIKKYASLFENKATGCTCVYNKQADMLFKQRKPTFCTMHDTWLYIVIKIFGETIYDDVPHISYRQHGNNVVGASIHHGVKWYSSRIMRIFDKKNQPRYYNAVSFLESYEDILPESDKKKIMVITNYKSSLKNRFKLMFDKDFKSDSFSRALRDKLLILLGRI